MQHLASDSLLLTVFSTISLTTDTLVSCGRHPFSSTRREPCFFSVCGISSLVFIVGNQRQTSCLCLWFFICSLFVIISCYDAGLIIERVYKCGFGPWISFLSDVQKPYGIQSGTTVKMIRSGVEFWGFVGSNNNNNNNIRESSSRLHFSSEQNSVEKKEIHERH